LLLLLLLLLLLRDLPPRPRPLESMPQFKYWMSRRDVFIALLLQVSSCHSPQFKHWVS
jgi:hypothetical protein